MLQNKIVILYLAIARSQQQVEKAFERRSSFWTDANVACRCGGI
jgi:hypothetical protein